MVKKDDEASVSSETKGPLKTFQALMGEGEKFSRDQLYVKAIQSYTEALDLLPIDDEKSSEKDINDRLTALVARSACYLKIGKNDLALQDAEESLKSNKEFTKGLLQKAEALYSMGEFELALMFFHRGKKLRSDIREFQLGINKAQEAIDNAVGDPNRVKLEATGDLSAFLKNDEDETKKRKKQPMGYIRASQKKDTTVQRKQHQAIANRKTTKQLLGDLFEDRIFLDKIINNPSVTKPNTKSGDAIYQLASEGIDYLDSRTDFWRQQEPIYARSKVVKKPEGDDEIFKHIRREFEAIDELQNKDEFNNAKRRAQHLVDFCERIDERKFSEKQIVLADVYSRLGNAYLELGDYGKALEYHNRDLKIGEMKDNSDRISHALDNLGRVYARSGQFHQAIQVWEKKIPLAQSSLEKAWLFHEIGQCHLGLGDYEKARRYGERSRSEAVVANDPVWQLNAGVLIAHTQMKLRQYREAEQTLNEALTLAKDQNDVGAERAIERSIREVREQIDKGAADSPPDRPETTYDIKIKSADGIHYADHSRQSLISVTIFGDNGSSGAIPIATGENEAKKFDPRSITLKKKAFDAGKLTKIALTYDNVDTWPLEYIEVSDSKRKNKIKFMLPQALSSMANTVDMYPEDYLVFPTNTGKKDEKKSKAPTKVTKRVHDTDTQRSTKSTDAKVEYTITVETGSEEFGGTDAKVFIELTGSKNKIARRQLDKSETNKDAFESGKKDVFKFTESNIGQLQKLNIGHDNSGIASGWFLQSVEIKYGNETHNFPVGRWLSKDENDGRTSIDLEPSEKRASKLDQPAPAKVTNTATSYVIIVQTGSVTSAGTDADVSITLVGDKNRLGPRLLKKPESGKNPFEKGNKDLFKFDELDIGKLKSIIIEHNGEGLGSGWYLDSIEIKVHNDSYTFPVDRWLDKNEDDGRTSLELEPNKKPSSKKAVETPKPPPGPEKNTLYVVTVETGNEDGAGTDANVFISLHGDKNKIEKYQLKTSANGKNPFEKGSTDVFEFRDIDIGRLQNINIQHDASGFGDGWFLNQIEVKVDDTTYKFPVERWLDKKEDDGRISLDLQPNKKPESKKAAETPKPIAETPKPMAETPKPMAETPKPIVEAPKNADYIISVKTGNIPSGGTDAKVMITLNGDKNKITRHVLDKPESGKNPFEIGNTDVFKFSDLTIGKLKTIIIEHDDRGLASGWFLDSLQVTIDDETTNFPVGRWLDKDEDDGRISLELEPEKKPSSKQKAKTPDQPSADSNKQTPYVVTTQTGSVMGAGTDANVYITLNGTSNKINRYLLKKSETARDPFELKSKDVFKFNEIDIGKLQTIVIEHDGTGLGSGWNLEFVEVTANNETTMFPVGRWLDTGKDDKRIRLELEPNKKPSSILDTEDSKEAGSVQYEIMVRTGEKSNSGTDANVYISLFGDKGKVERRHLRDSVDKKRDLFETGSVDRFQIVELDVGTIKNIRIEHDGTGIGSGWYLDSIEVRHVANDVTYKFPVDRWLDINEGDKRILLDLEPDTKPGQS